MAQNIEFRLKVIEDKLGIALEENRQKAKETTNAIEQLKNVFKDAGSEISKIRASFLGNLGANVVNSAFNTLGNTISAAVTNAREYSRAIAEVNSILPNNTKLTENQTKAFIALSSAYGKTAQSEAKAFYEIVSGGVEDTTVAFKILRQANEASIAGLTDVNVAAKTLTSTFNAFQSQGVTVNKVSDALFQAVKDGQTTFEELSGTLGRVSSIANAAGLTINDVAGSIAFLTKSGLSSDQAITGLRGVISAVVKPSQEAANYAKDLGINFNTAAIRADGFAGFLDKVQKATGGNSEKLAKLFGDVNAVNAVTSIAGQNFDNFRRTLDSNVNSLGATAKAAKELKSSFDFQAAQAEQAIKNIGLALSVALLPYLQTTLAGFKALTGVSTSASISIDEQKNKLSELAKEYNKIKDAIDTVKSSTDLLGGASDAQIQSALNQIGSVAQGEKRLNEIIQERINIRNQESLASLRSAQASFEASKLKPGGAGVDQTTADKDQINRINALNASKIEAESAYYLASNQLELENDIAKKEMFGTRSVEDIQALNDFELTKSELLYNAALDRAELLKTPQEKKLAQDKAFYEKEKRDAELNKKFKDDLRAKELSDQASFFNSATSLATSSNSVLAAIGKAAALTQIAINTPKAFSQAYDYGLAVSAGNPAVGSIFGGIAYAAQAAQAAKVAGVKGFANGGVIGATMGGDNAIVSVREGEMVLNANQQKNLYDMINNGGIGGDIVIQVDGREIARAVRSQLQQGFKLA